MSRIPDPVDAVETDESGWKQHPGYPVDHADAVDPRRVGRTTHQFTISGVALQASQQANRPRISAGDGPSLCY